MKILVLSGSPRPRGNTAAMVDAFARGARESGHQVEIIDVCRKKIAGCMACEYCRQKGSGHERQCVQQDDMQAVYPLLDEAEMILLASPVYFYTWSAQMKTVLDRTFAIEKDVKDTKFYLLSAGAAPTEDYMKLMIESFRSYIGCFRAGGNEEGGYVFGLSTNAPGDVTGTGAMEKAYRLGFELIGNR